MFTSKIMIFGLVSAIWLWIILLFNENSFTQSAKMFSFRSEDLVA